MIEIYSRDEEGLEHLIVTHETLEKFFAYHRPDEDDLKNFGYQVGDRTARHHIFPRKIRYEDPWYWNKNTRFCYLMYDYDKFITPDNLVGKYRDWWNNLKHYRYYFSYRCGAYQHGRALKVNNEVRQYYANDDEDAPRIRAKRSPSILPDAWDRSFYPSEKSWKTQSKRKHQWK